MKGKSQVIIIAALGSKNVIGTQHGMPWQIEEEYEQYLNFIKDQTVVMGRRTYEIFGNDLTSKYTLVVSSSLSVIKDGFVFENFKKALAYAKSLDQTVFIAGGANVYKQAIPEAEAMYLSYIHGEHQGDIYFPSYDKSQWNQLQRIAHKRFTFVHLARRKDQS